MQVFSVMISPPIDCPTRRAAEDVGPPDIPDDFSCLRCDGELVWHQPDLERPGRLLGTCSDCGGWHLLDESAADGDSIFVSIAETFEAGSLRRCSSRSPA